MIKAFQNSYLDNFDVDENYVQSVSSKYYDLSDLTRLNFPLGKFFSLFHVNTRSLSKNFNQFLSILSASNNLSDVLGITETKQQIDKGFLTNVSIDGYYMYTQPSKSLAGGVAIYVNKKLDHFERDGLSILHEDFESIWIEIKNKKGKNFLCGCIYCHRNTDIPNFHDHIESLLKRLDKNKYNVFIMGEFNIDLLQYESNSHTNDFINSVISHSSSLHPSTDWSNRLFCNSD